MGCFESRRRSGETAAVQVISHEGETLDQAEVKINECESFSGHSGKKLTLSMVSSKDKRYWDYDFKGT